MNVDDILCILVVKSYILFIK